MASCDRQDVRPDGRSKDSSGSDFGAHFRERSSARRTGIFDIGSTRSCRGAQRHDGLVSCSCLPALHLRTTLRLGAIAPTMAVHTCSKSWESRKLGWWSGVAERKAPGAGDNLRRLGLRPFDPGSSGGVPQGCFRPTHSYCPPNQLIDERIMQRSTSLSNRKVRPARAPCKEPQLDSGRVVPLQSRLGRTYVWTWKVPTSPSWASSFLPPRFVFQTLQSFPLQPRSFRFSLTALRSSFSRRLVTLMSSLIPT